MPQPRFASYSPALLRTVASNRGANRYPPGVSSSNTGPTAGNAPLFFDARPCSGDTDDRNSSGTGSTPSPGVIDYESASACL